MKPATLAAKNTIQRGYAVGIKPRVRAEWEYNRFKTPTVTVTPTQGADEEWAAFFGNLDSVALPNRPRTGIAKARTGSDKVKPGSAYRDAPQASRFYPCAPDDLYLYWSSEQRSGLVNGGSGYTFTTPIVITVTYDQAVSANKVVVAFETSYAKPSSFTIQGSANGTSGWFTIGTNPVIGSDGRVTMWRGDATWGTTADYDSPVLIKAVRLTVNSMDTALAHLDVLEVGARLENDLSDFLIDYDVSMECSDRSFIAPLGRASSNTASLSLSNIDQRFNNFNTDSLYYGLIDKKVKLTMDMGIDATPQAGAKYEYIREFTMWAENWGGQDQSTVNVDLKDSSVLLQEMNMPVVFFEDCTVGAIVWQIMDRIGMTNYQYSRSALDYGQMIPFYWPTEDTTTVWEEFANLAEATQTAIYFDENDVLQIKARKAMFDPAKSVDWNLDAIQNGQKLPDIVSTNVNYDLETNHVEIKYSPAAYADLGKNLPKMETAWEPEEDTVVLRASTLVKNLLTTGTELWITQKEAEFWPYESIVNIRGELLRYKGKEYRYYATNGTLQTKTIYSLEEKNELDALSATLSWKNAFTGMMTVVERNMFGSAKINHYVQPNGYNDVITRYDNAVFFNWNGGGRTLQNGYLRMTNNTTNDNDFHLMKATSAVDETKNTSWFGTRIRFPRGAAASTQFYAAGIHIQANDTDAGYFVELKTTELIDTRGYRASSHQELHCMVMPNNAAGFRATPSLGFQHNILTDVWYDLDVKWAKQLSGTVLITAYLNGVYAGQWTITSGQQPPTTGRFGAFVRGKGVVADFDYLYAFTDNDVFPAREPDSTNWLDLRTGSYTSGFVQTQYMYNFRDVNPYHGAVRFPQRINDTNSYFDEFAPVVHEVREFKVKFADEVRPVQHSNLYLSNEGQVSVLYYESDAFGASFMLANASRQNAIVKGDDTITFGADNEVQQSIFVYGRALYQKEEKSLIKQNDGAIRRRGPTKTEVDSPFIQTDEMANELGEWIIDLWASGVDELSARVFGNPFLQLGDLVTINYPVKDMTPGTHKYFVVSINNSFGDGGYNTELTLRRANA